MNERKTTARYYHFEDTIWETPGFANLKRVLSVGAMQLYAGLIWSREGGRGPCPLVRPRRSKDHSYFLAGVIHLAKKHRNLGGLLHEIAHALGTRDKLTHGPAFQKRCVRLYKTYGDWNGVVDWEKK